MNYSNILLSHFVQTRTAANKLEEEPGFPHIIERDPCLLLSWSLLMYMLSLHQKRGNAISVYNQVYIQTAFQDCFIPSHCDIVRKSIKKKTIRGVFKNDIFIIIDSRRLKRFDLTASVRKSKHFQTKYPELFPVFTC